MRLKYYADIKDAPLYGLLRQDNIKTENQFMVFFNSILKCCPETGRSAGAYIIFDQAVQLTMAQILQDQFLNQVHKVSIM